MSEQKYTPEPWVVHPVSAKIDAFVDGKPSTICGMLWPTEERNEEETHANASRIVACVNACAGIETETLETPGTIAEIIQEKRSELIRLQSENQKLREEIATPVLVSVNRLADSLADKEKELARLKSENARLVEKLEEAEEALEDVDSQFSSYEEDGKRYSGASIYLKIGKTRAALAKIKDGYRKRDWHHGRWNDATGTLLADAGWEPRLWAELPQLPEGKPVEGASRRIIAQRIASLPLDERTEEIRKLMEEKK